MSRTICSALRFGEVPTTAHRAIGSADLPTLERWLVQVLTAESVEQALRSR